MPNDEPSRNSQPGLCRCGCGERTALLTTTNTKQGRTKGKPARFVPGHQTRKHERYVVVETGHTSPCWIWKLSRDRDGYGRDWAPLTGKRVPAHRRYYEERYGQIPPGLQIDHVCRMLACVNPDHLEAVTGAENVRRGSNTKLNAQAVRWIRASKEKQETLARLFGVDQSHISRIKNNHTWREIELAA